MLIATDRRVILATPSSELPVRSNRQRFSIAWEIPYLCIRSCSCKTVNSCDHEIVTNGTLERTIAYKMPRTEGKALMAIVKRRAREASDESRLPRLSQEAAAA